MKIVKPLLAMCLMCITTTSCGGDTVLKNYNSLVKAVATGDYESICSYLDTTSSEYMTKDVLAESIDLSGIVFETGKSAKKTDNGYIITTNSGLSQEFALSTDGLFEVPDLFTNLDLYVPTGSECSYNGLPLTDDYISYSDSLETTYTIVAPIAPGILTINTPIFGDMSREVDPMIGDINEMEFSDDIYSMLSEVIIGEIDTMNDMIKNNDINTLKESFSKFGISDSELDKFTESILDNRQLDNPFTAYRNPVYGVDEITADMQSATEVSVNITFTVSWSIGEGTGASSVTTGSFLMEVIDGVWTIKNISDWSFMNLSVSMSDF